jgi:hypothetical protein
MRHHHHHDGRPRRGGSCSSSIVSWVVIMVIIVIILLLSEHQNPISGASAKFFEAPQGGGILGMSFADEVGIRQYRKAVRRRHEQHNHAINIHIFRRTGNHALLSGHLDRYRGPTDALKKGMLTQGFNPSGSRSSATPTRASRRSSARWSRRTPWRTPSPCAAREPTP